MFTVVQGDRVAVDALVDDPAVAAVSFVGSTPVARAVHARASAHAKRVQALGGAKNHMVVLPDAGVDLAADAAVSAAYGSAGERCMAVSVVVAVGAVADPLVEAIADRLAKLRLGPGTDPDAEMGPLVTAEHRDQAVGSYLEGAGAEGATVVVDGRRHELAGGGAGSSSAPRSSTGSGPGMRVYDDEIFGPVLSVVRADTYEEALAVVNANPYGNGAAIFTRDGGAARRFEREVSCGMVGVNVPIPVPVAYYSFGGWKASLFGDAHMYGPEGIDFYTRSKVVTTRWPDPATSAVDLGFPAAPVDPQASGWAPTASAATPPAASSWCGPRPAPPCPGGGSCPAAAWSTGRSPSTRCGASSSRRPAWCWARPPCAGCSPTS